MLQCCAKRFSRTFHLTRPLCMNGPSAVCTFHIPSLVPKCGNTLWHSTFQTQVQYLFKVMVSAILDTFSFRSNSSARPKHGQNLGHDLSGIHVVGLQSTPESAWTASKFSESGQCCSLDPQCDSGANLDGGTSASGPCYGTFSIHFESGSGIQASFASLGWTVFAQKQRQVAKH